MFIVTNCYIRQMVVLCFVSCNCVAKVEGSNEQDSSDRMHGIR